MVNNRKKNTANIILLVCALLFSSLEAVHSLVHIGCGQNACCHALLENAKEVATFSRPQDVKLQTRLIPCPVCAERFVAVVDHIAFWKPSAEPVFVNYPEAVPVFVTIFLPYSTRDPPYSSNLFV